MDHKALNYQSIMDSIRDGATNIAIQATSLNLSDRWLRLQLAKLIRQPFSLRWHGDHQLELRIPRANAHWFINL